MKKNIFTTLLILFRFSASACDVCKNQQPRLLRNITHGTGPESNWDYVIVSIVAIIALLTFFFSIKWLLYPGEKSEGHIKRLILNND